MPHVRPILLFVAALSSCARDLPRPAKVTPWDGTSRLERGLTSPQEHRFSFNSGANKVIEIRAEQRGIDIELDLFDADGDVIAHENWAYGQFGYERLIVQLSKGTHYTLRVRSAPPDGEAGNYLLSARIIEPSDDKARLLASTWLHTSEAIAKSDRRDPMNRVPEAHWRRLLDAWVKAGDIRGRAQVELYLGGHLHSQGEYASSLGLYKTAEKSFRAAGDKMGQARALRGIGNSHSRMGQYLDGIKATRASLELGRQIKDLREQAGALLNLGIRLDQIGRYEESLPSYKEAIEVFTRQQEPFGIELAQRGLAACYRRFGDADLALEHLRQAKEISETHGFEANLAGYYSSVAQVYLELLDDPATAVENYEESIRRLRAQNDAFFLAQDLDAMGLAQQRLGQPSRAAELSREALTIARAQDAQALVGQILWGLGRAERQLGEIDAARSHLVEAVALNKRLGVRRYVALARAELATIALDLGDLEDAQALIEAAIEEWDALRTGVLVPELRRTYSTTFRAYYDLYVQILLAAGRPRQALVISEQGRARALLEALGASGDRPWEQDLRLRAAADRLMLAETDFARHAQGETTERVRRASESALLEAREQVKIQRARWIGEHPELAEVWQPPTLNPASLQRALPEFGVLLVYHLGQRTSGLWRVTRRHLSYHALPSRTHIEGLARQVHQQITARNRMGTQATGETSGRHLRQADAHFASTARLLSDAILGPVSERLAEEVFIVPDGALNYVPWAALPVGPSAQPLIMNHTPVLLPAARVLTARTRPHNRSSDILVFADPVFEPDDPRLEVVANNASREPSLQSALRSAEGVLTRLPFSRLEAEAIAATGRGVTTRLGLQANKENLRAALTKRQGIIHFAVHGLLNSRHPDLSGLVLTLFDVKGEPRDGFLRTYEISTLPIEANLVVLSACQTALGREIRGEGLQGLTRAFLQAGARQVVASLWRIHDRATSELMSRFYRHLIQGKKTPSRALRAAQVEMLKNPRWASSYYWGAFIIQGGGARAEKP